MAAETAIASTQKEGQGDAVVLGNNTPNVITTLLKRNEQEGKAKAQGKLLTQKQTQDNKAKFFQNLSGLKDKVWYKDIPEITQKVTDLVGKAVQMQKSGVDPFDPTNTAAYTEIFGDVEKIGLLQGASKSAEERYNKAVTLLNQDKEGIYDKMKLLESMNKFENIPSIEERAKYDIPVAYAPVDYQTKLDKTLGDNIKSQLAVAKAYNDKDMVKEANDIISAIKTSTIPAGIALFSRELQTGQAKSPDEVVEQVNKWVDQYQQKALYDPTKNNQLEFQKQKETNIEAHRAWNRDFNERKFGYTKSQSMPKTPEVDKLFETIKKGGSIGKNVFAGLTLTETGTNTKFITGKSKLIKGANGNIIGIATERFKVPEKEGESPSKKYPTPYITYLYDKDGNDISSSQQLYTQSLIRSNVTKAPITNYTIDDNGNYVKIDETQPLVNQKRTNNESTTSTTKNSTATSGGSGNGKTYDIINPKTKQVVARGVSESDAKKAQAKGYTIK